MAILIKAIKPPKLKDDALRLELLNAMRKAGTQVKKDFEETTATWKHKPKFETLISLMAPGPTILVMTDDEIYGYVSGGTKPHPIFAGIYTGKSDKKVLAFKGTFYAKTIPGVIGSVKGGSFGKTVLTPYVDHPGSKPRGFPKIIQKRREKWYKREMDKAMSRAVKKSGYGE